MVAPLDQLGHVDVWDVDGRVLVSAHGQMDARLAPELRDALVPLAAADDITLILDLTDAHGVEEETLAAVSAAAHLIGRRGERLPIVTHSSLVLDLLRACHLDDIVDVHANLGEVRR